MNELKKFVGIYLLSLKIIVRFGYFFIMASDVERRLRNRKTIAKINKLLKENLALVKSTKTTSFCKDEDNVHLQILADKSFSIKYHKTCLFRLKRTLALWHTLQDTGSRWYISCLILSDPLIFCSLWYAADKGHSQSCDHRSIGYFGTWIFNIAHKIQIVVVDISGWIFSIGMFNRVAFVTAVIVSCCSEFQKLQYSKTRIEGSNAPLQISNVSWLKLTRHR